MSMSVPALELTSDVDLFLLTGKLREALFFAVSKRNCDLILEEAVTKFDKDFYKGELPRGFYGTYRKVRGQKVSDLALISDPRFDFVELEGRVFMLSSAGLSPHWKSLVVKHKWISERIVQDYSFFNASDQQVSSGELTHEEWRERSEFWHRNSGMLSRTPLLCFNVLASHEVIPDHQFFCEILETAPYASMESRREKLAKSEVVDRGLKTYMTSSKGTDDLPDFFRRLNEIQRGGYVGWEVVEASLPQLPELTLR